MSHWILCGKMDGHKIKSEIFGLLSINRWFGIFFSNIWFSLIDSHCSVVETGDNQGIVCYRGAHHHHRWCGSVEWHWQQDKLSVDFCIKHSGMDWVERAIVSIMPIDAINTFPIEESVGDFFPLFCWNKTIEYRHLSLERRIFFLVDIF